MSISKICLSGNIQFPQILALAFVACKYEDAEFFILNYQWNLKQTCEVSMKIYGSLVLSGTVIWLIAFISLIGYAERQSKFTTDISDSTLTRKLQIDNTNQGTNQN